MRVTNFSPNKTTLKEILLGIFSIIFIIILLALMVACENWFEDSLTEPEAPELQVDFECDGVRADGAFINIVSDDGVCSFRCVDLTFGGYRPYDYHWTTSIGESSQANPLFSINENRDSLFIARLEVTDNRNNRDETEKAFHINCI